MTVPLFMPALLLALSTAAAVEMPLPVLRIEPVTGGSVFYVRNTSAQPLTAYLIELVDYPGSSYSLWQEEITAQPVAPGAEKRIPVNNMTVGAVPDYVKLQAALFADGSSSGIPEKVAQLIDRRRFLLDTTRQLLGRLEKAGASKAAQADLKQWADSMQPSGKPNRNSQAFINQSAARGLIAETIASLDKAPLEDTLTGLRVKERALAASKPPL
jgi:hypothetical protein